MNNQFDTHKIFQFSKEKPLRVDNPSFGEQPEMTFFDTVNLFMANCGRALALGFFIGLIWYLVCTHMSWGWSKLLIGFAIGAVICVAPQLWDLFQIARDNFDTIVEMQSQQIDSNTLWSLAKAKLLFYVIGVVVGSGAGGKFSGAW